MQVERGFRGKLGEYVDVSQPFTVDVSVSGGDVYRYSCLAVDESDTLSPKDELPCSPKHDGATFTVNLAGLPEKISWLVFSVSIDGAGTMRQISSHTLSVNDALTLSLTGQDFNDERAIISAELYRKNGEWRFSATASGFNGGLPELLKHYGGTEQQVSSPKAKPVELRKGQKVNLVKPSGEIIINLNWHKGEGKGGIFSLFSGKSGAIDLDLGCLYELKDGTKGSVQALGKTFGSLEKPPYVALDGDDRTGDVAGGENLRVNGKKISLIRRILVYTFIYEGIANWQEADGVVTVKCPGNSDVIVRMDEHDTRSRMCAIAMLENVNDSSLSVEKLVRFFPGHEEMDRYYSWGLRWVAGRK